MKDALQQIEVRAPEPWGIQPVPSERRRLRAFDFAVLWGDLAISLLVIVAGSLLVPGLGTKEALLAVVVGNLIGAVLLAVAGIVGTETGVPTMVALRAALGIRGSYLPSTLNIMQLIGWAGLEIIIMASFAEPISDRYLGFTGDAAYYFWLVFFGLAGIVMALGGPVAVVRQWMQKFGVWVVVAASLWLTYHLFDAYDVGAIWRTKGAGGFPNFWQGVDLVAALPVSWLPLVCDYNRFARHAPPAAVGTYVGYIIANAWFFTLGVLYVQALQTDAVGLIDGLVEMLLPLTLGWLAIIVLLVGETDEAFANIYSTAVSLRNLFAKLSHVVLTLVVGAVAIAAAISLDLLAYETFLLLIGGVFVPLFGVLLADYFVVRGSRYEIPALYRDSGAYWYGSGVNPVGIAVWAAGFVLYALAAQPPWLLEHADFVSWAPTWLTYIGGTTPAFVFSFVAYTLLARAWLSAARQRPESAPAPVE